MFEFAGYMKEKMCAVAIDYEHVLSGSDPLSEEDRSYELPDGKIVQIDHICRYNASEILFQPKLAGIDQYGIAELAFDSVEKCDEDLKHDLYNNIVVTGGTTLMPGFKERLERDIKIQAQNVTDIDRIRMYTDSHRKYACWIGKRRVKKVGQCWRASLLFQICRSAGRSMTTTETPRATMSLRRAYSDYSLELLSVALIGWLE